jgi:hypothetical protein
MAESNVPDQGTEHVAKHLNERVRGALGILGVVGVTLGIVTSILIGRRRRMAGGHPMLDQLVAELNRWERDARHNRARVTRLAQALQHERRELEQYRRHMAHAAGHGRH